MLKLKMRTQRPKLGCVGALNCKVNFQTLIVVMIFHSKWNIPGTDLPLDELSSWMDDQAPFKEEIFQPV